MADNPSSLRDRAYRLRTWANRLEDASVFDLRRKAGSDTWIGPTATAYREMLVGAERGVRQAVEELRAAERRLRMKADILEEEQRRRAALEIVRS